MSKKKRYAYKPDYAVPPGGTLLETIKEIGFDQRELSKRTGLSTKTINLIIKGDSPITHETAIRLERVTGIPASMWNTLEANYREQLARLAEKEKLKQDLEWIKQIPTRQLIDRGAIEPRKGVDLLEEVLRFFGVASVDEWKKGWENPQFAFRKSKEVTEKSGKIAAWLQLCERTAHKIDCDDYDEKRFRHALKEIRGLTCEAPSVFVQEIISLCAESGVAVAMEPEIPGAAISGAAKWLSHEKAMIGLNLRGKTNDLFWFTFFHEAGHILNDSKKETYIDVKYEDDPREKKANRFAAELLIPSNHFGAKRTLRSRVKVIAFANSIGIAPGIVVGRLQREKIIPYTNLNGLKVKLKWG